MCLLTVFVVIRLVCYLSDVFLWCIVHVPESRVNWFISDLFYDVYCVACLEIFSVTELSKIFGLTAMSDSSNIPEPSVMTVEEDFIVYCIGYYCVNCKVTRNWVLRM